MDSMKTREMSNQVNQLCEMSPTTICLHFVDYWEDYVLHHDRVEEVHGRGRGEPGAGLYLFHGIFLYRIKLTGLGFKKRLLNLSICAMF